MSILAHLSIIVSYIGVRGYFPLWSQTPDMFEHIFIPSAAPTRRCRRSPGQLLALDDSDLLLVVQHPTSVEALVTNLQPYSRNSSSKLKS